MDNNGVYYRNVLAKILQEERITNDFRLKRHWKLFLLYEYIANDFKNRNALQTIITIKNALAIILVQEYIANDFRLGRHWMSLLLQE